MVKECPQLDDLDVQDYDAQIASYRMVLEQLQQDLDHIRV